MQLMLPNGVLNDINLILKDKSGAFSKTMDSDKGVKINDSVGREADLIFTNPNSSKKWGISVHFELFDIETE